jgi:nuclear transport factor 2 (NTF2) superfamily protein
MFTKVCSDCKKAKPTIEFYKDKRYNDGYSSYCKPCNAQRTYKARDKYRKTEKGKEAWKKAAKNYNESEKGKERRLKYKESEAYKERVLSKEGKDKINSYIRNKRNTDPKYRLSSNLRKRIGNSIASRGFKKDSKTHQILGIEFNDFRAYLEGLFEDKMSWDNYGDWHLDHIIPVSSAENETEIYDLNHYLNFQPKWAKDNISKSDNYDPLEKLNMLNKIRSLKV